MADIQKQFRQFDDAIKLRRYSENSELREKRDRVLSRLQEGLKKPREDGVDIPSFRTFNQGSYEIGTGIKPLDGEYDIDVGVEFDLASADHDPVEVKQWVLKAVENHTADVEMRGPCVTVYYREAGEPKYHVDLAVYSAASKNPDGYPHLARGKPHSGKEHREWTPSEPEGLTNRINDRFVGENAQQFKRVIRALKRWKDFRFNAEGNSAPRGIALAVAAFHWFQPSTQMIDGKSQPFDLNALRQLVVSMLQKFQLRPGPDGVIAPRLEVRCPVQPLDDLCARMTNEQMAQFKRRLEDLLEVLSDAEDDIDPHSACEALAKQFGDKFPIPPKEETAKTQRRPIVSSGNSG